MLTHALLAGGKGTRLFGASGGTKALTAVGSQKLIDYSIREVSQARPTLLKLVVPAGDVGIQAHARSLVDYPVVAIPLVANGTGPAVKALLEGSTTGSVVLTTCDLAGPVGSLSSFVIEALEAVESMSDKPMCIIAISKIDPQEMQPVYVDFTEGRVVSFGKGIAPTEWIYSGARVMNQPFVELSLDLRQSELSDTQMVAAILSTRPDSVLALPAVDIFDVDDRSALERAIGLERKSVAGLALD